MGDSSRQPHQGSNDGFAPTLQRSGDRAKDESPFYTAGTLIGERYRIEQPLGEGGMGRVYAGAHVGLGRRVAIKVLLHRYADQPAMVERFHNEARSASRIAHPNVVSVFDYGVTEAGEAYIVMDLLEGQPVSEVLRRGPMPLDGVVAILQQVALALRAAHAAGVVHRDLKPANIFLLHTPAGEPMHAQVLDFGMAKLVDLGSDRGGLTAAGEILGTPEYMAPEQAVGGQIDRRTDVYALGCLGFEMWCGHPPFTGSNYVKVLAKQLDEKPAKIGEQREAPEALESLIARALSKNKEDRPRDMDEVLQVLARVADEEALSGYVWPPAADGKGSATPAPASNATRQTAQRRVWLRRRTRRIAAAVALVLVGGLAGVFGHHRFGPSAPPSGPSTLVVTTTPPGAVITVDGRPLAEVTPAVAQVGAGTHKIEATLPHFQPAVVSREVKPGTSDVLRLQLVRDTYKMRVVSDPPGAQVSLDGFTVGTTPADLEIDPLDPHTLRLERLGRRPWEVLLPQGERKPEIVATLKKRQPGDAD